MAESFHEEEVLGKAYDARLMRRLLGYLRPYWHVAAAALAAIILYGMLQAIPPYLLKVEVDWHSRAHVHLLPSHRRAVVCPGIRAIVCNADRRAESDVRPAPANFRPPAAARDALLRSQPSGAPGDPHHHRRGRAERSVRLRRGGDLRGLFHAGQHHGGDA